MDTLEPYDEQAEHHDQERSPPQAQEHANEPANPAVAQLKSMFPDFDDAVLQTVLESVSGDQDAAIDLLLGMSDPSYVPATHHQSTTTHPEQPSSLELDEALARQLQLEDDRAHAESQQRTRGQSWSRRRNSQTQQDQTQQDQAPQAQGQSPQNSGGGPDLNEIKETLNQMAESGKRTFSSIVSRAKAKINEYQQSRPNTQQQQQQEPQHPPPSWGSTPTQKQPSPGAASLPNYYHETQQPVDRHAASQAYAHYYTVAPGDSPDLGEEDGWQQISRRGRRSEEKPLAEQPKAEIRGYDLDSLDHLATPSTNTSVANSPIPPPAAPTEPEPEPTIPRVTTPPSDILRPPPTQSGSPLNPAKFGLLPKRPVSLLTPQASGANAIAREASVSEDDEDELDYVENPFEEHKH
ncbi:uncharacterized protein PHACADRAFT_258770 [Phanerochaete carnosa HHB-10118-sp]|uniref:CUE domain-containing protein n=1 Tax=Phanerochaete carnosa (strain HHB-10118-sp) TaxID=650164 RepID=K5W6F5_PHACS|nr:uncharacterized protein PHACADRAFT_258770 [Phanerochaete carnosa HHB-10118-sp]EKM54735.1 hypothetical protein PHACADRAFT_258770 [Phanerochaete carnosa HHB-10118-sp]